MVNLTDLLTKKHKTGGRGPDFYDCLGLSQEILRRVGRSIPNYEYSEDIEMEGIHSLIDQGREEAIELERPEPWSIVAIQTVPKFVTHIGIVLDDCRNFIHILEKVNVKVDSLNSPYWRTKTRGFYRSVI